MLFPDARQDQRHRHAAHMGGTCSCCGLHTEPLINLLEEEPLPECPAGADKAANERSTQSGPTGVGAAVRITSTRLRRMASFSPAAIGRSARQLRQRFSPKAGTARRTVDDTSAKELFNVTLRKFVIPVIRRGVERLLRASLESETGLHIGLLDGAYTVSRCRPSAAESPAPHAAFENDFIRAFSIEVSSATVVNHSSETQSEVGSSPQLDPKLEEFCTVMPADLQHVAEEGLTLDVDFDLDLHFGEAGHQLLFQLRSQRRFLPDLGASFGLKHLELRGCCTRVWWSFSEQKLLLAFRAQPDVKLQMRARLLSMELPTWVQDEVLALGLKRLICGYSLKNPLTVPMDGEEVLNKAHAMGSSVSARLATGTAKCAQEASEAAQLLSEKAEAASASSERAMHDSAASSLLAWEAFACATTVARKTHEMAEMMRSLQAAAIETAEQAAAVSKEAECRIAAYSGNSSIPLKTSRRHGDSPHIELKTEKIGEQILHRGRPRTPRRKSSGAAPTRAAPAVRDIRASGTKSRDANRPKRLKGD